MVGDVCPNCRRPMTFHAITVTRADGWRRWVECFDCKTYVRATAEGMPDYVGSSQPAKNILARDQSYGTDAN
jgi:hypothetical protein